MGRTNCLTDPWLLRRRPRPPFIGAPVLAVDLHAGRGPMRYASRLLGTLALRLVITGDGFPEGYQLAYVFVFVPLTQNFSSTLQRSERYNSSKL